MPSQTSWGRGCNWTIHHLEIVGAEYRELLGNEVLTLVGGRLRKLGER